MFKKFMCCAAVAAMMVSCGGAGEKTQDTVVTDTVKAEVEVITYQYEKTGNELLDSGLEMLAKIATEFDNAKTEEERIAIFEKFGEEQGKWFDANGAEFDKITDEVVLNKFVEQTTKMADHMTLEVVGGEEPAVEE